VLCLLGARIWPGAVAAVLLALVAGSSLALFAVLTKGVVEAGEGGVVALLRAPELYAWLAVALAGMVFQQASFRAGSLTASLPTMTLAKPVIGWILGITVLSEDLHVDGVHIVVLVAAVIVMIVSTVALARGEAAGMEAFGRRRSKATRQPLAPSNR
ncbi:MAG: DMT family transporter, partial [Mycobacterium sp.]